MELLHYSFTPCCLVLLVLPETQFSCEEKTLYLSGLLMLPVALYPVGPAVQMLSALDGAVVTHCTSLHWDAGRAALACGLVGDNGTIQPLRGPLWHWAFHLSLLLPCRTAC